MRASILLLFALAAAFPAAAQHMPANPPAKVERAELPPPGSSMPPPRESAGSSSAARDDEALFREFDAWLKQHQPPIPQPKPAKEGDSEANASFLQVNRAARMLRGDAL